MFNKEKEVKTEKSSDLKVRRLPIGIPGFDGMIEGGFPEKSINMVAGGSGSGKTIFAIQFLLNGALKCNEPGIFITFEEEKEQIFKNMSRFGWDLEELEKANKLIIIRYSPEQVRELLAKGGGSIEDIIEKIGAKRIAIDSIKSFALLYENELTKKEASFALFKLIRRWGCTALFTSQDESLKVEESISPELEFEVDSVILLYNIMRRGNRQRAIEVLKMRGTNHKTGVYKMEITNKGIKINQKEIVVF